jgi:tetratricopeptide (TPR) repeat protein
MPEQETPSGQATTKSPPGTGSIADVRLRAAQLFNDAWRLMEQDQRTAQDDDLMIHTAHASRYHWGQVPDATPNHLARGEWQVSRVYSVLGRAEPALHHARRVLEICQQNSIGDFDLAFAYEALARAHAVAGHSDEARRYTDSALSAAEDIADDDDRGLLNSNLETIPGQPRYW